MRYVKAIIFSLVILCSAERSSAYDCTKAPGYDKVAKCVPTALPVPLVGGRQLIKWSKCGCDSDVQYNDTVTKLNTACIDGVDCSPASVTTSGDALNSGIEQRVLITTHPAAPLTGCKVYWFSDGCQYSKCVGDTAFGNAPIRPPYNCGATTTTSTSSSTSTSTSSSTSSTAVGATTSTSTSSTSSSVTSSTSTSVTTTTSTSVTTSTITGSALPDWCTVNGSGMVCWNFDESGGTRLHTNDPAVNCPSITCDLDVNGSSVGSSISFFQEGTASASFDNTADLFCNMGVCDALGPANVSLYIGLWVRPTSDAQGNTELVRTLIGGEVTGFTLVHMDAATIGSVVNSFACTLGNGTSSYTAYRGGQTTTHPSPLNTFAHVACIFDNVGKTIDPTANGVSGGTLAFSGSIAAAASNFQVASGFSGNGMIGQIDELVFRKSTNPMSATSACRITRCGAHGEKCWGNGVAYKACTSVSATAPDAECGPAGICTPSTSTCAGRTIGICAVNNRQWCDEDADCTSGACTICTLPNADTATP